MRFTDPIIVDATGKPSGEKMGNSAAIQGAMVMPRPDGVEATVAIGKSADAAQLQDGK
ncbi:MAG: hypothetical protein H7335_08860 [Massilia sp.]|nr:hypothetical protein [Massilia sp.]